MLTFLRIPIKRRPNARKTQKISLCVQGGGSLAFGSDWPVVEPKALLGAYVSVHRKGPDETNDVVFFPTEGLAAEQALRLSTIEGARMVGLDHLVGSLR